TPTGQNNREFCSARGRGAPAILEGIRDFGVIVSWEAYVGREKHRGSVVSHVLRERVVHWHSWHSGSACFRG
ncbi:hypothetical protein Taro_044681, partial [Colocasia esculenta]|nr:hypothetical protein [Colocasia esculenta]